jgi:hypothetical protein
MLHSAAAVFFAGPYVLLDQARHHTLALSPLAPGGLRTGDLDLAVENFIQGLWDQTLPSWVLSDSGQRLGGGPTLKNRSGVPI